MQQVIVARRDFTTDDGILTLQILTGAGEPPSFEYQFLNEDGTVAAELETFGADSLQALLFCMTAAGDYLDHFVPPPRSQSSEFRVC
ncbi:hypothetical protein ACFUTX_15350 [Microbacterium sp. NPDC057407]|uniref:hypothetical protein n=1 Tax=Microbacterium sp. NPDC057407 TaxID=3346120 RepID=UPI00366B719E